MRLHSMFLMLAVLLASATGGIDYMAIDGTRFRRESIPLN